MRIMSTLLGALALSVSIVSISVAAPGGIRTASESVCAEFAAVRVTLPARATVAYVAQGSRPSREADPLAVGASPVDERMDPAGRHAAKLAEFNRLVDELQTAGDLSEAGAQSIATFLRSLDGEPGDPGQERFRRNGVVIQRHDGEGQWRRERRPDGEWRVEGPHEWRDGDVEWRMEGMPPDVRIGIEQARRHSAREERAGDRPQRREEPRGKRAGHGSPRPGRRHMHGGLGGFDPLNELQGELARMQMQIARMQLQLELLEDMRPSTGRMHPGGEGRMLRHRHGRDEEEWRHWRGPRHEGRERRTQRPTRDQAELRHKEHAEGRSKVHDKEHRKSRTDRGTRERRQQVRRDG